MLAATTSSFTKRENIDLQSLLLAWNLGEDLAVINIGNNEIRIYAREGAASWPFEWSPNGDDEFEPFDIEVFLNRVAVPDQEIESFENNEKDVYTTE